MATKIVMVNNTAVKGRLRGLKAAADTPVCAHAPESMADYYGHHITCQRGKGHRGCHAWYLDWSDRARYAWREVPLDPVGWIDLEEEGSRAAD